MWHYQDFGKVCLSALALLLLSSVAYSQDAEDQIYQAAAEIIQLHPDMKPQIKKIAASLREISINQQYKQTELQTIIDRQALQIAALAKTLQTSSDSLTALTNSQIQVETDLKRYAANLKTEATVSEILLIVSLVANGVQLFIKK